MAAVAQAATHSKRGRCGCVGLSPLRCPCGRDSRDEWTEKNPFVAQTVSFSGKDNKFGYNRGLVVSRLRAIERMEKSPLDDGAQG